MTLGCAGAGQLPEEPGLTQSSQALTPPTSPPTPGVPQVQKAGSLGPLSTFLLDFYQFPEAWAPPCPFQDRGWLPAFAHPQLPVKH